MTFSCNAARVAVCTAVLMAPVSCGGRIGPRYATTGPTVSKISWTIAHNATDGAEHIVCRSESRTRCTISPSAAQNKSLATMHVYLHPSITETRYTGTIAVTFLNGFGPDIHEGTVDSVVKPGDEPFDVSVSGPVTQIPGVYVTTISLVARSSKQASPQTIRDDVAVAVK